MGEKVLVTVEMPMRGDWSNDQCQFIGRFHRFKKWWKFWEENFEDMPLKIVNLKNSCAIKPEPQMPTYRKMKDGSTEQLF